MTSNEYFTYSIRHGLLKKLYWYTSTMTINPSNSEYVSIKDNKVYVDVDGTQTILEDADPSRPIFIPSDLIQIYKEDFINLQTETEKTYFGRAVTNYLLLILPFKDKIGFINSQFSIEDIESKIVPLLQREVIKVPEYLAFVDSVTMLQGLSPFVSISATPKNMVAPAGLKEFKAKLAASMVKKYGPNWTKNQVYIVEYKSKLREYDEEWLKDDPSNNKIISGQKVKGNARSKMYLTFGAEQGFDPAGTDAVMESNSLMEGYTLDKEKLTMIFNSSRYGSYSRGKETQKGGAVAKDVLRATSSITVADKDCGSTIYKEIFVTPALSKNMVGRFMKTSRGVEEITDPKAIEGKTIEIRSPLYCKLGGKNLCKVCCGKKLEGYESGVSLLVTDISGTILKSSLKLMHNTQKKAVDVHIDELIKD